MHDEAGSLISLAAGTLGVFYVWQIGKAVAVTAVATLVCPWVFVPLAAVTAARLGYMAYGSRAPGLLTEVPARPVKQLGWKLNYD